MAVFNREVNHRDGYTLKAYRAGRSTGMAARGFSFGYIQLARELSSEPAPFCYINTIMADGARELMMLVEEELEEDQHEVAAGVAWVMSLDRKTTKLRSRRPWLR